MKKLSELLVIAFVLSGCGLIAAHRQQEAFRQAEMIAQECRQKRLTGKLKGHAESARCSNDRMRQVIAESGYPYMDLIDVQHDYKMWLAQRMDEGKLSEEEAGLRYAELNAHLSSEHQRRATNGYSNMDLITLWVAYRKALAERVDKGDISEAEANLQLAELQTRISSEEQRRNALAQQQAWQRWQAWQSAVQQYQTQQQLNEITNALTAPRTMSPITCQQFGNMIECQ